MLEFTQAFFTSLLRSTLDCIIVSDDEGVILEWNDAAVRTFGYDRGHAIGRTMSELIVPDEMREAHAAGMKRYIDTRIPHVIGRRIEILARHAQGYTFPVELAIAPFEHEGRTLFVASLRDLTEIKKAQQEREQEQRFYQAVLDALPTQLAVFSPEAVYLYVTPSAIRDSAVREWVLGKTDLDYCRLRGIPDSVALQRIETVGRVARSGNAESFEESFIGPDQKLRHFIRYVVPVSDAEGRVTQVLGYGLDVTELKEKQIELRLRDRAIMSSSNGIIITDPRLPDNPIVFVNPAFERITGYASGEILGRNPRFLQSKDTEQPGLRTLRTALEQQSECSVVLRNYGKNDALYWTELSISPVFSDEGELTHYIGIQTDVTDRIAVQEQLEQARDLAVAADRAKSEFLAIMSHEIRTPMNGVIGATELLLNSELDARQKKYIETIRDSGDLLLSVINDILDFSKIEAGKFELDEHPTPVEDCIRTAMSLCEASARARGLTLHSQIDPSVPKIIITDGARLRQILVNLIANGVKFTDRGEVTVEVEAGPPADGRVLLQFRVRDTGIGMTAEFLDRIFEPFSQADSSSSRIHGGSGLGLAITSRLVALLGGAITVESSSGSGSVFVFSIRAALVADETPVSPAIFDWKSMADFTSLRALVVEDNAVNRHLLLAMLEELGISGRSVHGGAEAIEAIRTADFDLVFMDIQMPGMDGREATRRIRREFAAERQPMIIALTASVLLGERQRSLDAGMNDFLSKPLRMEELLTMLKKWNGKSIDAEARRQDSALPEPAADPVRAGLLDSTMITQIIGLREGEALLKSLIAAVESQVPELTAAMNRGIETGDQDLIARSAHRLASACSTVGLQRLQSIASEIEVCGLNNDLPHAQDLINLLPTLLLHSFDELDAYVKNQTA